MNLMIKRLCIFTISFAFDRQGLINFLEKIIPPEVELFLFVSRECKGKYYSTRAEIIESESSKYLCFLELRKFCRKNKIDRIFTLGALPQEGFIATFSTFLTKTNFISYLVVNPYRAFLLRFNKHSVKAFFEFLGLYFLLPFPQKICVITEYLTDLSKRFFPHFRYKIFYLKYPINTEIFKKKNKEKIRKKLNLAKKQKIAIFVGRIEYLKGADIILEIAKEKKDILFIMIGQVRDKSLVDEKLPNVKIIDSLSSKESEKLCDYYNAADLCLFPSRIESFALVPREAMACGTPAIVADITGMNIIKEATKVPLYTDKISEKVDHFFNMTEKQRRMLSKRSQNYVLKECSGEVCKQLYIEQLLL